ncbi:MAG: hypothetical protein ABIO45_00600 [Burkholderiaceae bacterium]
MTIGNPKISSTARNLFCIAAMAAASVPAFAQSREFQRGYEQGYRDGVESTQNQGPDRRGSRIRLERAVYGFRGEVCDATEAVRNVAGGRRNVMIAANNDLCGDSAPNRPKTLTVTYRCADEAVRRVSVREGQSLTLTCR